MGERHPPSSKALRRTGWRHAGGFECNTVTTSVNTGDFECFECNMLHPPSVTIVQKVLAATGPRARTICLVDHLFTGLTVILRTSIIFLGFGSVRLGSDL